LVTYNSPYNVSVGDKLVLFLPWAESSSDGSHPESFQLNWFALWSKSSQLEMKCNQIPLLLIPPKKKKKK